MYKSSFRNFGSFSFVLEMAHVVSKVLAFVHRDLSLTHGHGGNCVCNPITGKVDTGSPVGLVDQSA